MRWPDSELLSNVVVRRWRRHRSERPDAANVFWRDLRAEVFCLVSIYWIGPKDASQNRVEVAARNAKALHQRWFIYSVTSHLHNACDV